MAAPPDPGSTNRPLSEPSPHTPEPADHSLRRYLVESFEVVTNADSRLVRTFRTLLTRPGELTAAYFSPRRDEYLRPQQVLLFCSIFFFFMQPLLGLKLLATPLSVHLKLMPYRHWAAALVAEKAGAGGLEAYRPVFDAAAGAHARTLAFLLVPLFALVVTLLFWRPRHFFVRHLVFATHFVAYLLLMVAPLAAVRMPVARLAIALGMDEAAAWQMADSLPALVLWTVYLYFALQAAYGHGRALAAVKALALCLGMAYVITAYRFILFATTFYGL